MSDSDCCLGPSSVLQSPAWERFQMRLGRRVQHFHGTGWHGLAIREHTGVGTLWYMPYGPVLHEVSVLPDALRTLRSAAREHGVAWLRLEPQCPPPAGSGSAAAVARQTDNARALTRILAEHRGRRAPRDIQPALTRWVNLAGSQEQILSGMTGTNRNLWRRHRDKGISIAATAEPEGAEAVIGLLHRTASARGFTPHDAAYLRTAARSLAHGGGATTYTSMGDGNVVSAILVYDSPTTRIFAHSGMDQRYRKLRPNQPLIVQALLDAAAQGQAVGDLFGVTPSNDPGHPWAGFSAFKRSFGGVDVPLGGTWDVPVSAVRYRGYRLMRSARDRIRAFPVRPGPSATDVPESNYT